MNIEINYGNECNLNCSYCFLDKKVTIDFKYIQDTVLFINKNKIEINEFRPVGGEPLLHIENIIYTIDNLIIKPKNISIVTNGILLRKTINQLYFISSKYNINLSISVSIDNVFSYDHNRKISSINILMDLLELKEYYKTIEFSINSVVLENNKNIELELFCKNNKINIFNIPFISNNTIIKNIHCNKFCGNGLYFFKDKIYLCKLCHSFFDKSLIGDLNSDYFILKSQMNNSYCLFNKEVINK